MDSIVALQVIAINVGAFAIGSGYGSGLHAKHRVMFALNIAFNVWNLVGLFSRLSTLCAPP